MKGTLFLIPSALGDGSLPDILPVVIPLIIRQLRHFIVEDVRTARRYLKKIDPGINIDDLSFRLLNEHSRPEDIPGLLEPLNEGNDTGLLSEAGLPCIADPGSLLVSYAHENGIRVIPLSGPSSIFLALMASGFNGQNFAFHGYLPVDKKERILKIKELENSAYQKDQTQIFIETPYRNLQMLDALILTCKPETKICVALNLTLDDERIIVSTAKQLDIDRLSDINRKPAVFLIYR